VSNEQTCIKNLTIAGNCERFCLEEKCISLKGFIILKILSLVLDFINPWEEAIGGLYGGEI
jgi:hypothetical protein